MQPHFALAGTFLPYKVSIHLIVWGQAEKAWLSAVVKLWPRDFQHDETCYVLRFQDKGGRSRQFLVPYDLQRDIPANLDAAGIKPENGGRPLFHSTAGNVAIERSWLSADINQILGELTVYPANLFNLFPPFPHEDKVFVAMSFAPQFQSRWENVIAPAIRDVGFEPFRVDLRKISDSILTDITRSIANHRLVFGDISVMFVHEEGDWKYPVRNPNVMYEVGLAHSVRLPEEVILFRSDREDLPFDVMNIRVNSYDPDQVPDEARVKVREALSEAMREVDRSRLLSVESAARKLSANAVSSLFAAMNDGGLRPPTVKNMHDVMSNTFRIPAINSLIEQGLLACEPVVMTPDLIAGAKVDEPAENLMTYRVTPFGDAVFRSICSKMMPATALQGKYIEIIMKDGKPVDFRVVEPDSVEGEAWFDRSL